MNDEITGECDDWPFDQRRNCAIFTMRQILEETESILLVSHDEDDHGWHFIGATDANMTDAKLVCLNEMVRIDPTVLEVADLPPGWQALRTGIGLPWVRRRRPQRDDDEED